MQYLTKVWIGRHWWYLDTKKKYKHRNKFLFRRWCGIVSYAESNKV